MLYYPRPSLFLLFFCQYWKLTKALQWEQLCLLYNNMLRLIKCSVNGAARTHRSSGCCFFLNRFRNDAHPQLQLRCRTVWNFIMPPWCSHKGANRCPLPQFRVCMHVQIIQNKKGATFSHRLLCIDPVVPMKAHRGVFPRPWMQRVRSMLDRWTSGRTFAMWRGRGGKSVTWTVRLCAVKEASPQEFWLTGKSKAASESLCLDSFTCAGRH